MLLRRGMTVRVDGRRWRVGLVNSCRARLDPLDKTRRTITDRFGKSVDIEALGGSLNVSANADVEAA